MMVRSLSFLYGAFCYLFFLLVFLYAVGFLGNFLVPKSIDSGVEGPFIEALLVNVGLLLLFGLQHSIMARGWFKRAWTKIVPPQLERSTYVLFSNIALALLFWLWQPAGQVIWDLRTPAGTAIMYGLFAFGWAMVFYSTVAINHFDLFGMRQVLLFFQGKEYSAVGFKMPWPYKFIRHPLYLGWLFAFWSTPLMTASHLIFAVGTTAYILVAIGYEERDLLMHHGESYQKYREATPMLIPFKFKVKSRRND